MSSAPTLHIAIDGNEANVANRVGSNVYAYQLLTHLAPKLALAHIKATVLLRQEPLDDLPTASSHWDYQVLHPEKLWTQWALPRYLFRKRDQFSLLFTPGHYAPLQCPIPYISSVMDTAYEVYPHHFRRRDYLQLKHWTARSVRNAAQVIAISQATKKDVMRHYQIPHQKISVLYPGLAPMPTVSAPKSILRDLHVEEPYFLFIGTLQPRKNIPILVKAFELCIQKLRTRALQSKKKLKYSKLNKMPKLVLAGKVGWLSESSQTAIDASPFKQYIIQTGFITESQKKALLKKATATVLLGMGEGFGLPPLESMSLGTPIIVSNTGSLPEVAGDVGSTVSPTDPAAVAELLLDLYLESPKKRHQRAQKLKQRASTFSWDKTADQLVHILKDTAKTEEL